MSNYCPSQNLPFDTEQCQVCAQSIDECVCQECPTCGEYGEPECYEFASTCKLVLSDKQQALIAIATAEMKAEYEAEKQHNRDMFNDVGGKSNG